MINELKKTLDGNENKILTENGAVGYSTTGKVLVDLNFKVPSRHNNVSGNEMKLFEDSFKENCIDTVKWLFYLRDIREGLGERDSFVHLFYRLYEINHYVAIEVLPLIPEYGRWKDLIDLLDLNDSDDNPLSNAIYNLIATQLKKDLISMTEEKPVSLAAKWMPSINASVRTRRVALKLSRRLGFISADYRKMLSALRKYIDVTEVKTCGNRWSEIDYNKVSSNANARYYNAFMRHDEERRNKYLADLSKPGTGAVMHASTLYPYEVYAKYGHRCIWGDYGNVKEDTAIEELWKNLKDIPSVGNTLCVCDNSGSMDISLPGTSAKAIDVSRSLSIFFGERCKGEFKDKVIAFSSNPHFIDFSKCNSLADKVSLMNRHDDCSNTDIERTFDLILKTAIDNHLPQDELPENILIISDMEFDGATTYYGYAHNTLMSRYNTLFENIGKVWESYGYKLPRLIFWNVNSRSNAIQLTENECGVVLVSGFSVNNVKMILSGEFDPYKALKSVLDSKRYDRIDEILKEEDYS